ncbi:hypothetical protein [Stenotrophomonas sp. Marseille-Q4652]|nr:hypothetical protein [Stenotrophomonas sp. Marseille-Q4652]
MTEDSRRRETELREAGRLEKRRIKMLVIGMFTLGFACAIAYQFLTAA